MAQRRMFSKNITDSDAFLDMGQGAQNLYFHLGMQADDDGFVDNLKKVSRMIGAAEDDAKVLLAKRFLLDVGDGVQVIKHWRMNNQIRRDRYTETKYVDKKDTLLLQTNGAYTTTEKEGAVQLQRGYIQPQKESGNHMATTRQPSIGKVRLGKVSKDKNIEPTAAKAAGVKKPAEHTQEGAEILKAFEEVDKKNKTYYGNTTQRKACDWLIATYGKEEVLKRVAFLPIGNKQPYFPHITTPHQLKEKWSNLQDAVTRFKTEKGSGRQVII